MSDMPDRLSDGTGVAASEPGAEREYEQGAKNERLTCGRCRWTWDRWYGGDTCPRCRAIGFAIGQAFHFVEAVCMERDCGVVEEVHGSRVTGYSARGYLFCCVEHQKGETT